MTMTYCSGLPVAAATALESAANNGFPFSSGRGTVVSSFSNGIQDLYTGVVLPSSGENDGTCRRVCALLIL